MDRKNTIETISRAVKSYFAQNGITVNEAARLLGKSPQNLTSSLAKGIGKNFAQTLSDTFGFSQTFLLTGEGKLLPDDEPAPTSPADLDELRRLRIQVDDLMQVLHDQSATIKSQSEAILSLSRQKGAEGETLRNTQSDYLARFGADQGPRNR